MDEMDWVELQQAVKGLTKVIRAYFDECVEQGFSETQALRLTLGYQSAILNQSAGSSE